MNSKIFVWHTLIYLCTRQNISNNNKSPPIKLQRQSPTHAEQITYEMLIQKKFKLLYSGVRHFRSNIEWSKKSCSVKFLPGIYLCDFEKQLPKLKNKTDTPWMADIQTSLQEKKFLELNT